MTAPLALPSSGSEETGADAFPPASPLSPFREDGFCRSCGGFAEHFARCPHATWEKREL